MPRTFARLAAALLLCAPTLALATPRVFVTLQDDGTIEGHALKTQADLNAIHKKLLALYKATGEPMPEILSVWTTFPFAQNNVGTIYDPFGNDVTGIGLETAYPPKGLIKSNTPPLKSILFHNNVLALADRAPLQNAPVDGYARYLFLLELSHNWGPALQLPPVPMPNGQTSTAGELMGSPLHWSFWMDAGGSPAGGNVWKDNGDGTFTNVPGDVKTLQYSLLDLYIMGLATPEEVPPFGVLEGAVPPKNIFDPLQGGAYAAHSLTYFDTATPFTAKATRRALTMQDVLAANGQRAPAADKAQNSWQVGIVLLVSQKDAPDAVAAAQATFAPIAAACAPDFHDATRQRGTLEVVTYDLDEAAQGSDADAVASPDIEAADATSGEGLAAGADAVDASAPAATSSAKSGCAATPTSALSPLAVLLCACAAVLAVLRRRTYASRALSPTGTRRT